MPLRSPAAMLAALLLFAASLAPARADVFTDAAGRHVVLPDRISRVLPAERNAEVLVLVLAPDKLAGLSRVAGRSTLVPRGKRLPVLGWRPRSTPASMAATARQLGADLIVDAGTVTPERAAFADAVQRQTGIPYILVDDSFARMPAMLRSIGAILGVSDRADDLALYAEHAIAGLRGRLLIRPPDTRPRVYYALGRDGLRTALPGSPAGAALDEAGAINVAAPLGRGTEVTVSPAQLLGWDPDVIIAEERAFYDAVRRNSAWRRLAAVREKRVYLEPTRPFGWIEDPTGVNRLIGLHWLSTVFYPGATQEDLRTTVCDFYDRFYRTKLTNAQVEALVRPAGAPPPAAPRAVGMPLLGLGAAPPAPQPAAPSLPGALPGVPSPSPGIPGIPSTAPDATCTVPTGPTPQPLPGISDMPSSVPSSYAPGGGVPAPAETPGVPPPGRRGRPVTGGGG